MLWKYRTDWSSPVPIQTSLHCTSWQFTWRTKMYSSMDLHLTLEQTNQRFKVIVMIPWRAVSFAASSKEHRININKQHTKRNIDKKCIHQKLTWSYLGSQHQQEQTKVFLFIFDGFSCLCSPLHCLIQIRYFSSWVFGFGIAKNSTNPSKLFWYQVSNLQVW